jgi:hypothetical protein
VTDIQSVGGVRQLTLRVDDVEPPDVAWKSSVFFHELGDDVVVKIREVKPGGRTYNYSIVVNKETLRSIVEQLTDQSENPY